MSMPSVTIRLSPQMLARLRVLAHLESLRTGRDVTWSGLVRGVIETHLLGDDPGQGVPNLPPTSKV